MEHVCNRHGIKLLTYGTLVREPPPLQTTHTNHSREIPILVWRLLNREMARSTTSRILREHDAFTTKGKFQAFSSLSPPLLRSRVRSWHVNAQPEVSTVVFHEEWSIIHGPRGFLGGIPECVSWNPPTSEMPKFPLPPTHTLRAIHTFFSYFPCRVFSLTNLTNST